MPRNEEGEFELVLGNRQLLSVFFIVVVLLGVFFTVGYIIGRSSAPAVEMAKGKKGDSQPANPILVDPAKEAGNPASSPPAPGPGLITRTVPPSPDQPPAKATAPPVRTPPSETPPEPPQTKKTPPPPPPAPPAAAGEPVSGQTFLQVAAVKRPEAELLVEVLQKKGFRARLAAGPSEALFRVLVGPLADTAAITETKASLESAGFKSILRKY